MWRKLISWKDTVEDRELTFSPGRGSLLSIDGLFLCLGEWGHLFWLDLSPEGCNVLNRTRIVPAKYVWGLPVVSHGLLYINQSEKTSDGRPPRLLCFDLRAPRNE